MCSFWCFSRFSDGMVYVFTSDVKRMASEADQQAFLRSVRALKTGGLPVLEERSADGARGGKYR